MARATLIGFSAVVMWALLTDAFGRTPPSQLAAICFAIGTGVGLVAVPSLRHAAKARPCPR